MLHDMLILSGDISRAIVSGGIRARGVSCRTFMKLHTYRYDSPSMQFGCTYAAVNAYAQ